MLRDDSRLVRPGDAFVAVRGAAADGASFISAAIEAGASEIYSELPPLASIPLGVAWHQVSNARSTLAQLAAKEAGNPTDKLSLFGVTGTNGKTTIANILRWILAESGIGCGLISTIINDTTPLPAQSAADKQAGLPLKYAIGVAAKNTTPGAIELQQLLAQMLRNGCSSAVMEVSSHALDQRRADSTRFACAVFTNLTQDHLDYHKTFEAYFAAKRRLFLAREIDTLSAAINIDDPYGRTLLKDMRAQVPERLVYSYGFSENADFRVQDLKLTTSGMTFCLKTPFGCAQISSLLMGRHNALNIAAAYTAAICAAKCAGLPIRPIDVVSTISRIPPVRGRLEPVVVNSSNAKFFVDYAHTPDALGNVLRTLREITANHLFVVFGAGGDRDKTKRPKMGAICAQLADYLIVTSDNPRSEDPHTIISHILDGIPQSKRSETIVEADRASAIRLSKSLATDCGDVVLIAGKGHEDYQIFADRTIHFDDREILSQKY